MEYSVSVSSGQGYWRALDHARSSRPGRAMGRAVVTRTSWVNGPLQILRRSAALV